MGTVLLNLLSRCLMPSLLLLLVLPLLRCRNPVLPEPSEHTTSFETDSDEWSMIPARELFEPTNCDAFAERSDELSNSGLWSFKLWLDNSCDTGSIGIKKRFFVTPNTCFLLRVEFQFATSDFGDVNLWRVGAGVSDTDFSNLNKRLTKRGTTGNGSDSAIGFVWLEKAHEFSLQTGSTGDAFVAIGVAGSSEFTRSYYVDDVRIILREQ